MCKLDGQMGTNQDSWMDAEPKKKTGESTNQGTQEPTQETPQSKLRDLRPEKDPMGAGRNSLFKARQKNPS
jgi:hypothetical protein